MITTSASNLIPVDLHCHSTNSDGALNVIQLLDLVKSNGGKYIALTDHDTVDGINEAKEYASKIDLCFIPGVEISVTWDKNNLVHIVGLNVDHTNKNLINNLNNLRDHRLNRGLKIAEKLAKVGIPNALEGAMQFCSNPKALSRTHFNRFLVQNGYAKPGKAFEKFLAHGKPGYVDQKWASLEDAVSWIIQSGGVAVIAHPARYGFTRSKLIRLINDFKQAGGLGIEIISSSHSSDDIIHIAHIATTENLYGSIGSDFHNINESYKQILVGINPQIPDKCLSILDVLKINIENFN
ncbi:MAG: PHP domain-containing protein [Burkholderiales bacterium]|nr:PHP domain-containing protein [Burkholderiales bacterium]